LLNIAARDASLSPASAAAGVFSGNRLVGHLDVLVVGSRLAGACGATASSATNRCDNILAYVYDEYVVHLARWLASLCRRWCIAIEVLGDNPHLV
jgi:hypothetical protein